MDNKFSYFWRSSSSSRASMLFSSRRSDNAVYPSVTFSNSSRVRALSCHSLSIPSRRASRSSTMTCSCIWKSSLLWLWTRISSSSPFSRCLSKSSASVKFLIFSSNANTFTSSFCFSACNSMISSVWFRTAPPSTSPSASLSFILFTSSSIVSLSESVSICCCCNRLTSPVNFNFNWFLVFSVFATSSSCSFRSITCWLFNCLAFSRRPRRNPSTCCRKPIFLLSTLLAACCKSSSCTFRSQSTDRLVSSSACRAASLSSWRLRT
mmetsp:Transcript_42847/g.118437  ORF Transcript_42847/g.118437 Transcript_42847/m.118437 type:complete len:265 (-) Transcript_42847:2898-3692(-)